ncbi:MAG: PDZ domain-containing protein [Vicinamibacterales bacterium]
MDATPPRNPRYVVTLAVVSGLILIIGWLARPHELPDRPPPVPSVTELEQLARRAERRALEDSADFFRAAVRKVETSIVRFPDERRSGMVWNNALIVTGALPAAAGDALAITAGGVRYDVTIAAASPDVPVAAVRPAKAVSGVVAAPRAEALPAPGNWVLAVWRTASGSMFAAGHFRNAVPTSCAGMAIPELASSVALDDAMIGGGLFDLDGALLGLVARCDGRVVAIAVEAIQGLMERTGSVEQLVAARFGASLEPIGASESAFFKRADGLLVRDVREGQPAAAAGLRPGDIVIALDDQPIAGPDGLAAAARSHTLPLDLTVRRWGRSMRLRLGGDHPSAGGPLGVTVAVTPSIRIDTVATGSPAAAAGLRAADVVLRVNESDVRSLTQVNRVLAGASTPVWLEVERGGRRMGMLLRAEPGP